METIKTIFNSPVYQYDFFSGSGLNNDVTWGHTVRKLKIILSSIVILRTQMSDLILAFRRRE